jgi:hypothetical protein
MNKGEPLIPGGTVIPIPIKVMKRGKGGKPELVEDRTANFTLAPAAPGKCPECATDHLPEMPHNQQSLFWQYRFYGRNGRFPTWLDALEHCSPEMKAVWIAELAKKGIIVEEDKPDGR